MIGQIQELGTTSKGGPKVKINNTWFYPNKSCPTEGLKAGLTVEFESKPFPIGDPSLGKTLPGLQAWRLPEAVTPSPSAVIPAAPVKGKQNIDPVYLPCVSNVLAHAIDSKAITKPEEIRVWVECTVSALTFPFDDAIEF
jgi:hypothetical protein